MSKTISDYFLILWSENPDKLKDFYVTVLGLKLSNHLKLPDDYGFAVVTDSGHQIWIGKHSETKGKNKDKYRFLINFYVRDVDEWFKKLSKNKKVKLLTKVFVMPHTKTWKEKDKRYCFTFLDPEGNILQMTTKKQ